MTRTLETTIAVAGAGPVGMSLAIDAAMRGVDVVVLEARQAGEPPSAKCNTVGRALTIHARYRYFRDFNRREESTVDMKAISRIGERRKIR